MLLFLINKLLKTRKNNTLVLILHVLTQKLHLKPARINKDSNLIVEHCDMYYGLNSAPRNTKFVGMPEHCRVKNGQPRHNPNGPDTAQMAQNDIHILQKSV